MRPEHKGTANVNPWNSQFLVAAKNFTQSLPILNLVFYKSEVASNVKLDREKSDTEAALFIVYCVLSVIHTPLDCSAPAVWAISQFQI